jgi:hypothetical protein
VRHLFYSASLATAVVAAAIAAPAALAQHAPSAHYSVSETKVAKLLDDPGAAEVLKRMIPTTFANEMFQTLGRDLTLKDVQQYAPDELSDANLAKIQAEFDKIPAK